MKKVLVIVVIVISLGACAGKQPKMARQVTDEVNRINMELPQRINYNTTLERVTFDQIHSILVCHYTVYRWDRDNGKGKSSDKGKEKGKEKGKDKSTGKGNGNKGGKNK